MRALVLALLLGIAFGARAGTLGGSYFYSADSDSNDIHKQTAFGWASMSERLDIGGSLTRSDFRAVGMRSNRLAFQHDHRHGAFASRSDVGIEQLSSRSYLTGDASMDFRAGSWTWSAGAERALVDSIEGLKLGLTATTAYAVADWSTDRRGAAVVLSRIAYSDDNIRRTTRLRLWQNVCDCGIYAQLSAQHYSNSSPYAGNYFSPRRYARVMAGVGTRQRFGPGTLTARVEYGTQRVDGERHPSSVMYLAFESARRASGWQWQAAAIRDQKQPGYTYTQGTISIFKRF